MKLYHVSFNKELPSILLPKLPAGEIDINDEFSEPPIDRVCFSSSIEGCIRAIYPNISDMVECNPNKEMTIWVYTTELNNQMYRPLKLTKDRLVHDAHVTSEYWSLKPTMITRLGKIGVNFNVKTFLKYKPFDLQSATERDHSPLIIAIKKYY